MAAKRVFDARNSHVRSFPVERNVASFGRRGTPRTKLSLNVRPIGTCWNPRCVGSTAVHPNHVGDVQAGCFGRAEFVRVKRSRNEPNATCTRIGNSLSSRIHCGRQFRHCATELSGSVRVRGTEARAHPKRSDRGSARGFSCTFPSVSIAGIDGCRSSRWRSTVSRGSPLPPSVVSFFRLATHGTAAAPPWRPPVLRTRSCGAADRWFDPTSRPT
mmetsp:Transcript_7648/g.47230  ORF Transcript_7648/g.47230 Transcript_7648/m.47230 type:complete len:215 (+) Transcript_7648:216-860(+)